MTSVPPADSSVLAAERAHLQGAREGLTRMRERSSSLSASGGDSAADQAIKRILESRILELADQPDTPLFFGRIDDATTSEAHYIGRRHVQDEKGDPLVLDWRADIAMRFYRASHANPMNTSLRRRFGFDRGQISAFEDEHLANSTEADLESELLASEIERPRVGPMRDIVSTIQPEQDSIVRAPLEMTTVVQGAPGTGKTAVGLHRLAFLLYAHRERLRRAGVLIVGPNDAFLNYIQQVLPALGEVEVRQTSLTDLAPHVPVTAEDLSDVAAVKGDPRMATVLKRAVYSYVRSPTERLTVPQGARRWYLDAEDLNEIVAELLQKDVGYNAARAMLVTRIVNEIQKKMESAGLAPDHRAAKSMAKSAPVRKAVSAIWPVINPSNLIRKLLEEPVLLRSASRDILTNAEQALVSRGRSTARDRNWTIADRFLIDEVVGLLDREPSLGHVVLDEAQDLSAMQLRAVGRRCSTGSATILGDLAQGTTQWAIPDWPVAMTHLGKPKAQLEILNRSYRVPSTVIDFASQLLPTIAPGTQKPESVPGHVGKLRVHKSTALRDDTLSAVSAVMDQEGSVAIIAAPGKMKTVSRWLAEVGTQHDSLTEPDPRSRLTLAASNLTKGLEFDHVLVVEPADIVDSEAHRRQGLRRIYVVLTRAVSSLTVVHARPLPQELSQAS